MSAARDKSELPFGQKTKRVDESLKPIIMVMITSQNKSGDGYLPYVLAFDINGLLIYLLQFTDQRLPCVRLRHNSFSLGDETRNLFLHTLRSQG
jgi:hypothetical protein